MSPHHLIERIAPRLDRPGFNGRLGTLTLGALAIMTAIVGAAVVSASHGSDIDLTTAGAVQSHNGALWTQNGFPAGTGNFDPFLTIQSNEDTEHGYNTLDGFGEPDAFFGGGRTHELRASAVPELEVNGVLYREFLLDANDQGVDANMSIDEFKIFLDPANNLTNYDDATETFSGVAKASIYDLDDGGDTTVFILSQGLEPGSGVSDIQVLVPNSAFPEECRYGAPVSECSQWLYVYTEMGAEGVVGEIDWNVTAGFEEWRTSLLPVVHVAKTVTATYTDTAEWDIEKTADPEVLDLLAGESDTTTYTIDVTRTGSSESELSLTGTITITNPTGGAVIGDNIPATILSVNDIVDLGAGDEAATVDCGVSFPHTISGGEELVCSYELESPSSTTDGTNVATVTLDLGDEPDLSYSDSADVNWVAAPVNDTVNVSDTNGDNFGPFSGSGSVNYEREFVCAAVGAQGGDAGTHNNTATIDETGQNDSASVVVICSDPPSSPTPTPSPTPSPTPGPTPVVSVEKSVTATYTETFEWGIEKTVDPANWDLLFGEGGTSEYTIKLTQTGSTISDVSLTGTITIMNTGSVDAEIVSVTDAVDLGAGDELAAVNCGVGFPHTLGPDDVLGCTYELASPSSTVGGSNLATVVVDPDEGSNLEYTGSADVSWVATLVNDEVNVSDSNGDDFGPFGDSTTITYDREFVCAAEGEEGGDEGTHNNIATIVETELSDSASVTVDCSAPPVTPTPTVVPTVVPPAPTPTPTPEVAAAIVGIDNTRTSPSPALVGEVATFRIDVTLTGVPATNVAEVLIEFDETYLEYINSTIAGAELSECTLLGIGIACLFGVQDANFSFDVHFTALEVTESTATDATLGADFDGAGPGGIVVAGPARADVAIIDIVGIPLPPLGDGTTATGAAPWWIVGLVAAIAALGGTAGMLRRRHQS